MHRNVSRRGAKAEAARIDHQAVILALWVGAALIVSAFVLAF